MHLSLEQAGTVYRAIYCVTGRCALWVSGKLGVGNTWCLTYSSGYTAYQGDTAIPYGDDTGSLSMSEQWTRG